MPRVREETITGFAHCPNPRCEGYAQEQIPAVKTITEFTYKERGGDIGGVETSTVDVRAAAEEQRLCACGLTREVTDQPRKRYAPESGHSQTGLLEFGAFNPDAQRQIVAQQAAEDAAGLRKENAELREENKGLADRVDEIEKKMAAA